MHCGVTHLSKLKLIDHVITTASLIGFRDGFSSLGHRGFVFSIKANRSSSTSTNSESGGAKADETGELHDDGSNEMLKLYLDEVSMSNDKRRRVNLTRAVRKWRNDKDLGTNWSEAWTSPEPFDPHRFPFDIRMGAAQNMVPKPHKYGNLELVKVQNFLHLTPPSVKNHCQKLKEFCTAWPDELATDQDCEREFPLDIHTADYVRADTSQDNHNARTITLRIRLSHLVLDSHARDKIVKLAASRYDPRSDMLTLQSSRCPLRCQNRQYLHYLVAVLYYEAWKVEPWEVREYISDEDGCYWWDNSRSFEAITRVLNQHPAYREKIPEGESVEHEELLNIEEARNYRDAVVNMKLISKSLSNEELKKRILLYKNSVRDILKLPSL